MKLVSSERMRFEDKRASENFGIPGILLMENAASEFVRFMENKVCLTKSKILVVCGGGNNGGDGFAIARKLFCKGHDVSVYAAFNKEKLTESAGVNYSSVLKLGIPFSTKIEGFDYIVDALLGIGVLGDVRDDFAEIINKINNSEAKVFSVDIPSGICADSGRICGCAVKADYTVTMAYGKPGLYTGKGMLYSGEIYVADICLPQDNECDIHLVDEGLAEEMNPQIKSDAHKGTNGTLCVAAGSKGMTGAAALCCMGALRSSAGIVKLLVPENLNSIMEVKLTEAITIPVEGEDYLRKENADSLPECDALVIGPGLGRNEETLKFVQAVIKKADVPLVIDADGIYAVSMNIDILREAKKDVILTPHPGEFSRLCGLSVQEIENNRVDVARAFAEKYGVTLLLKGPGTVVAEADGTVFINTSGNEGMAKGGSGDVLSGIIGALLCRGVQHPAELGAFLHGRAGDKAAEKMSKTSMLPSDILKYI